MAKIGVLYVVQDDDLMRPDYIANLLDINKLQGVEGF